MNAVAPLAIIRAPAALRVSAISVVVPLHDEAANVAELLRETRAALAGRVTAEIILVDDGSTDGTAEEARRQAAGDPPVRLLRHPSCRGQSTAVYNGVRAARYDWVIVLDGDLQNDPADIPILIGAWAEHPERARVGLVIGHRVARQDSAIRRLSSRIANAMRARLLRDETPDTGCGLKLIRRSAFSTLPYCDHMHRFLPALMQQAGFEVVSVPVSHRPRVHGRSKYGIGNRLWVGIVDLFGVMWLASRNRRSDVTEEQLSFKEHG